MTNNVLDQILFGHPQEHLHGEPEANHHSVEIAVKRYSAKRDRNDGPRRIDLTLTLARDQHRKLLQHLARHADDAEVEIVLDLSRKGGIMPPDPLGPVAIAAFNFATGINALNAQASENLGTPPPPADYLEVATRLLTQIKAGFSFGASYLYEGFSIPSIMAPPTTNNTQLDSMLGTLVAAVNTFGGTVSNQTFDPSSNSDQLSALLRVRGTVESAFSQTVSIPIINPG